MTRTKQQGGLECGITGQLKLPQSLIELVGCGKARGFGARGCVKGMSIQLIEQS